MRLFPLLRAALPPRQIEVAELLMGGLSNADISERMGVSEKTVKQYMVHLCRKFDIPIHLNQRILLAIKLTGWSE